MRISLQRSGGFAAVPGLNKPIAVDTAQLPAAQRDEIERLVAAARFFDQPAASGASRRGAADVRTYTLTIEDAGRSHTVRRTEPIEEEALGEIVDWLEAHRRGGSP